MPTHPIELAEILDSIQQPGSFYASGVAEIHTPSLTVEGIGAVDPPACRNAAALPPPPSAGASPAAARSLGASGPVAQPGVAKWGNSGGRKKFVSERQGL